MCRPFITDNLPCCVLLVHVFHAQVRQPGTMVEPPSASTQAALQLWGGSHGQAPSGGTCFLAVDMEFYDNQPSYPWSVTVTDIVERRVVMDFRVRCRGRKLPGTDKGRAPAVDSLQLLELEEIIKRLHAGAREYARGRLVIWHHWGGPERSTLRLDDSGFVVDTSRLPAFLIGHTGPFSRLDLLAKRILGPSFKQAFWHHGTHHCAAWDTRLMTWLLWKAAARARNADLLLEAMLQQL